MLLMKRFAAGIMALFQKRQLDHELDEELDGFIQAAAEAKMRGGMTRAEAMRAARIEVGSAAAVKDQVHESGWESIVDGILQDLRYCFRILRNNPGFTALAVLTLAVGIGASTTVFGWIDAVLLHPLPGISNPLLLESRRRSARLHSRRQRQVHEGDAASGRPEHRMGTQMTRRAGWLTAL